MPAFTVLAESGRRVTVRPGPSDTLQSVVSAACAQLPGVGNPESYVLVHKNATLPLATMVRLANLPQGATLELKRASTLKGAKLALVKVALQIVGAGRVINDFAPAATLWDVLVTAETRSNGTLSLTERYSQPEPLAAELMPRGMTGFVKDIYAAASSNGDGVTNSSESCASPKPTESKLLYQQPVVVVMNKEYSSNDVLQTTTLRSLGFTGGNVMIRLSFKQVPVTLEDLYRISSTASTAPTSPVSSSTQPPTKPEHTGSSGAVSQTSAAKSNGVQPQLEARQANTQNTLTPEPAQTTDSPENSIKPCQEIRVFNAPPANTAPLSARFDLPASFYEVGSDEAKLVISAQRARQAESERGFKSRKAEEAEAQQRREDFYQRHQQTVIRFRFPDQVQVQSTFASKDRVASLYNFVSSTLKAPQMLRMLVLQPPVQDLASLKSKTLIDAKLTPAAVVHVRLTSDAGTKPSTLALLKPSLGGLAEPLELPAETNNEQAHSAKPGGQSPLPLLSTPPPMPSSSPSPSAGNPENTTNNANKGKSPAAASKMPKWFVAGQRRF
ncbi:hypothetical protein IWW36_002410 [Coemansia brasiliensis]|uniref:UBX domain-containing protein n=1 Tax=Coemansia brasiliensis TaxID=2650707 RepID=A0A9W8IDI2_9FUNG|nr:hypothetical protein IWW36_002410 [Coemansia brasiliensis]